MYEALSRQPKLGLRLQFAILFFYVVKMISFCIISNTRFLIVYWWIISSLLSFILFILDLVWNVEKQDEKVSLLVKLGANSKKRKIINPSHRITSHCIYRKWTRLTPGQIHIALEHRTAMHLDECMIEKNNGVHIS